MTAYNTSDLYNKYVQEQSSEAFRTECINGETYEHILQQHVCNLYIPNYFIRIGSALLTIVCILFSGLLLGLLFVSSDELGFFILCIFLAGFNYGALELLVKQKKYYNAGVDNILMLSTLSFIITAFFIEDFSDQYLVAAFISTLICFWFCKRFTDSFMAMLCYLSGFLFLFLLYTRFGTFAKATAPFMLMGVSATVFFVLKRAYRKTENVFYKPSLRAVMLLALITFYVCGNYFVVKELSNQMFDLKLGLHDTIPMGWLFWIFTAIIPPAYIFYGIKKKDLLFIRTGLLLIAVTIFTVRYYYSVLDVEVAMIVAGLALITISYILIRYLKTPRRGFTFDNTGYAAKDMLNAEALIIAQTFGEKATVDSGVQFGGGSSGGGGATGSF